MSSVTYAESIRHILHKFLLYTGLYNSVSDTFPVKDRLTHNPGSILDKITVPVRWVEM
jgi:hypothetical protein